MFTFGFGADLGSLLFPIAQLFKVLRRLNILPYYLLITQPPLLILINNILKEPLNLILSPHLLIPNLFRRPFYYLRVGVLEVWIAQILHLFLDMAVVFSRIYMQPLRHRNHPHHPKHRLHLKTNAPRTMKNRINIIIHKSRLPTNVQKMRARSIMPDSYRLSNSHFYRGRL